MVQKDQMPPITTLTSIASSPSLAAVASRPSTCVVLTTSSGTAVPARRSRRPLSAVRALATWTTGEADHDALEKFANRYRNDATVKPTRARNTVPALSTRLAIPGSVRRICIGDRVPPTGAGSRGPITHSRSCSGWRRGPGLGGHGRLPALNMWSSHIVVSFCRYRVMAVPCVTVVLTNTNGDCLLSPAQSILAKGLWNLICPVAASVMYLANNTWIFLSTISCAPAAT